MVIGLCCRMVCGVDGLMCVSCYMVGWLLLVVVYLYLLVVNDVVLDVWYWFDGVIVMGVWKDDCGFNVDDVISVVLECMRGRKLWLLLVLVMIGRIVDEKWVLVLFVWVICFFWSNVWILFVLCGYNVCFFCVWVL